MGTVWTEEEWHKPKEGGRYRGGLDEKGKRQGFGRWEGPHGEFYEGDWDCDQRHGCGTALEADGTKYSGDWVMGHKHGQGTSTNPDGVCYEGWWENDLWDGSGKLTGKGFTYVGTFKRGLYHGNGALCDEVHRVEYEGDWVKGQKEGKGVLKITSGGFYAGPELIETYDGDWKDNLRHGQGIQHFKDKSTYDGSWKNGVFEGKGTYSLTSELKFEGYFKEGLPVTSNFNNKSVIQNLQILSNQMKNERKLQNFTDDVNQGQSRASIGHQENPRADKSNVADEVEQSRYKKNPYLPDIIEEPLSSGDTARFEFTSCEQARPTQQRT